MAWSLESLGTQSKGKDMSSSWKPHWAEWEDPGPLSLGTTPRKDKVGKTCCQPLGIHSGLTRVAPLLLVEREGNSDVHKQSHRGQESPPPAGWSRDCPLLTQCIRA